MNKLELFPLAAAMLMSQTPAPPDEALRLMNQGQYPGARQAVTLLIEEATRIGAGLGYRANLLHLLATTENQLARYAEAERTLNEGLRLCEQQPSAFPETHVSLLILLAEVYSAQGQVQAAEAQIRLAHSVAKNRLPDGHSGFASVLGARGTLYWTQGQLSRAESAFRQALAILEARCGPSHPDANVQLGNLAALLVITGRRAEAVPMLERARKYLEEVNGANHPRVIGLDYSLAVALTQSAPARAESVLRDALSRWRISQPELHPNTAVFLNALAWTRFEQRDVLEATALNERALAISRELLGKEHAQVVALMYDRSRLLQAAKRSKEAALLKSQADRIRSARGYAEIGRHSIDINALKEKDSEQTRRDGRR